MQCQRCGPSLQRPVHLPLGTTAFLFHTLTELHSFVPLLPGEDLAAVQLHLLSKCWVPNVQVRLRRPGALLPSKQS